MKNIIDTLQENHNKNQNKSNLSVFNIVDKQLLAEETDRILRLFRESDFTGGLKEKQH
jgi:hypothetical protein